MVKKNDNVDIKKKLILERLFYVFICVYTLTSSNPVSKNVPDLFHCFHNSITAAT